MSLPTIHATAIVIGTTGLLFVGPSGAGKSSTALACLSAARRRGLFGALIADDRVVVTRAQESLIARAPPTLTGLAELRGFGILSVDHVAAARLSLAIRPLSPPFDTRIAPEAEVFPVAGSQLPLAVLPLADSSDPLDLLLRILLVKCS